MSNVLNDTQQSLAAAIARLEIQRLRIDKLKLENVHLRNVLRAHDINPGEGEEAAADADASANEEGPAKATFHACVEEEEPPIHMPDENDEEKAAEEDSDSHNILLHTPVDNSISKVRELDASIDSCESSEACHTHPPLASLCNLRCLQVRIHFSYFALAVLR